LKVRIHQNQAHINTKLKLLHHKGLIPKLNKLTKETITIEENEDIFYYDTKVVKEIEIPEGSYEVMDIVKEIQKHFPDFNLQVNSSTMKATLMTNAVVWDFTKPGLGTKLLGFYGITIPGFPFLSTRKINVNNINVIRVQCNIANGSFLNGNKSHTIHSFYPQAPPGYKIIEVPKNILYFPVNKQILDTVTITFADQDNKPIDFNGEETTITCHIKKV